MKEFLQQLQQLWKNLKEIDMCIFGASGHGKVIASILLANKLMVKGFIDDNPKASNLMGLPVIHSKEIKNIAIEKLVIAIGDNKIRKIVSEKLQNEFNTVIHPSAIICKTVKLNSGTVVFQNAVINAEASIGSHCIINTGAIVEHDCVLGDFVHVSPNATIAGNVHIGEGTHIGIGACIIPGISIGKWVTIGAGAVIIKNVPDGAVMVGNPARNIKK